MVDNKVEDSLKDCQDRIKNIQKDNKIKEEDKKKKIHEIRKRIHILRKREQEEKAKKEVVKAPKVAKKKEVSKPRIPRISVPKEIDFETYFSIARRGNKKLKAHHMRPMKVFFEQQLGKKLATKEEFDKFLIRY